MGAMDRIKQEGDLWMKKDLRLLKHPKPWLLTIGLFYIIGTVGALDCETISIIRGIGQAIGGLIMQIGRASCRERV